MTRRRKPPVFSAPLIIGGEQADAAWQKKHVGSGRDQVTIIDRALSLNDGANRLWYQAFEEIDQHTDIPLKLSSPRKGKTYPVEHEDDTKAKARLLYLLSLGNEISPSVQRHLANLLKRHRLIKVRGRGRPEIASYAKSPRQELLWEAGEMVREDLRRGFKLRVAVEEAILTLARVDERPLTGEKRNIALTLAEEEIGLKRTALAKYARKGSGAERRRATRYKTTATNT